MEKHLKEKKLGSLSDKKKKQAVFEIIQSEVLVPVKKVWEVYSQASRNTQCAAKFLCQVNEEAKTEGGARWVENVDNSDCEISLLLLSRQSVTRAASLAAGWTLSKASIGSWTKSKSSQDNYWNLHHVSVDIPS